MLPVKGAIALMQRLWIRSPDVDDRAEGNIIDGIDLPARDDVAEAARSFGM